MRCTYDLALLRNGSNDPTTRISVSPSLRSPGACIDRATFTPLGPGSIRIAIEENDAISSEAWGPGANWLQERVERLTARHATRQPIVARHGALHEALRKFGQEIGRAHV